LIDLNNLKKIIIVTGLSGSGKTTTLGLLEDIGYFCVDNIPPKLLNDMLPLFEQSEAEKIALGVDARWKQEFDGMIVEFDAFLKKEKPYSLEILFLESSVDTILKRYNLTRRKHPLSVDGDVEKAVLLEKKLLSPLRERADYIIDTSIYNTHELRKVLVDTLTGQAAEDLKNTEISITSFGFKYGTPLNADFIIDSRFLPNPYWKNELTALTGLDKPVQDYLRSFPIVHDYLTACCNMLLMAVERYNEEGRSNVNVYFGCSGGKHRSVYLSLKTYEFFTENGFKAKIIHREINNWI